MTDQACPACGQPIIQGLAHSCPSSVNDLRADSVDGNLVTHDVQSKPASKVPPVPRRYRGL